MSRTTHVLCDACMEVCRRERRAAAVADAFRITIAAGNAVCCGCAQRLRSPTMEAFHMSECPEYFVCQGFHEGDEPAPVRQ